MPVINDNPEFESGAVRVTRPDGKPTLVSGRIIFSEIGLTDLNRSPIKRLQAFILDGTHLTRPADEKDDIEKITESQEGDKPPFKPDKLSEALLVDGSIFAIDASLLKSSRWGNEGLQFQHNVAVWTNWLAYATFIEKGGHSIIREYIKVTPENAKEAPTKAKTGSEKIGGVNIATEPHWIVTDYKDKGDGETGIILNQLLVPEWMIFIFLNGQGLLYEVQLMYRRLEEIKEAIRDKTTGNAVDLAIIGHIGDVAQAASVLQSGVQIINIPQQAGSVQMERIGKSEVVSQLSAEFIQLKTDYLNAMQMVQMNDATNMSGISRRLFMSPMLKQVERVRSQMEVIYHTYDWTIAFNKLTVLSVEERLKEMELIKELQETTAIDLERANELRNNLI